MCEMFDCFLWLTDVEIVTSRVCFIRTSCAILDKISRIRISEDVSRLEIGVDALCNNAIVGVGRTRSDYRWLATIALQLTVHARRSKGRTHRACRDLVLEKQDH